MANSASPLLTVAQYTDTSDRIFEVSALPNIPIVSDMREWITDKYASCSAVDPQRFLLCTFSSQETWEMLKDLFILDSACVFAPMTLDLPCSLGNSCTPATNIALRCISTALSILNFLKKFARSVFSRNQMFIFAFSHRGVYVLLQLLGKFCTSLSLSGSVRIARTTPEINFLALSEIECRFWVPTPLGLHQVSPVLDGPSSSKMPQVSPSSIDLVACWLVGRPLV